VKETILFFFSLLEGKACHFCSCSRALGRYQSRTDVNGNQNDQFIANLCFARYSYDMHRDVIARVIKVYASPIHRLHCIALQCNGPCKIHTWRYLDEIQLFCFCSDRLASIERRILNLFIHFTNPWMNNFARQKTSFS
jgi:hypothetical protein